MIRLTNSNGDYIAIAPEHVTSIQPGESSEFTVVISNGEGMVVSESREEVTRKILDYKLLQSKYSAYMQAAAASEDSEMEESQLTVIGLIKISLANLAGLEG
jgi:uncharacterized protein YlzI (FlbEa/FlbD family)